MEGGNRPFKIVNEEYNCIIKLHGKGYYVVIIWGNLPSSQPLESIMYRYKGKKYFINVKVEDDFHSIPFLNNLKSELDYISEHDFIKDRHGGPYISFRSSDPEKYSPVFGRNVKGGKK